MKLDTLLPLSAYIEIADVNLTCEAGFITMVDQVDKRKEVYVYKTESEACQIISDFMKPEEPGKAFCQAFPFWV